MIHDSPEKTLIALECCRNELHSLKTIEQSVTEAIAELAREMIRLEYDLELFKEGYPTAMTPEDLYSENLRH